MHFTGSISINTAYIQPQRKGVDIWVLPKITNCERLNSVTISALENPVIVSTMLPNRKTLLLSLAVVRYSM